MLTAAKVLTVHVGKVVAIFKVNYTFALRTDSLAFFVRSAAEPLRTQYSIISQSEHLDIRPLSLSVRFW